MSEEIGAGGAPERRRRGRLKDVDSVARARSFIVFAWLGWAGGMMFLATAFGARHIFGLPWPLALLVGLLFGLCLPAGIYGLYHFFVIGGATALLSRLYGAGTAGTPTPPTYWRAAALSARGEHAEALRVLEAEAARDPNDPSPCLRAAALCLEELHDRESAVRWYLRARAAERVTPETDAYVSLRLADLYESLGRGRRAAEELRRILERHPGSPYVEAARARLAQYEAG
jgi:hypothetical protein